MKKKLFISLSALLIAAGVNAQALKKVDGVLVDAAGKTVYTFDKDTANSGKSACVDACLKNWPAVPAPAQVSAPYSAITRDDGSRQLAYQGKPLYTFVKDEKAGERKGDNVKDMWHVVKE